MNVGFQLTLTFPTRIQKTLGHWVYCRRVVSCDWGWSVGEPAGQIWHRLTYTQTNKKPP